MNLLEYLQKECNSKTLNTNQFITLFRMAINRIREKFQGTLNQEEEEEKKDDTEEITQEVIDAYQKYSGYSGERPINATPQGRIEVMNLAKRYEEAHRKDHDALDEFRTRTVYYPPESNNQQTVTTPMNQNGQQINQQTINNQPSQPQENPNQSQEQSR